MPGLNKRSFWVCLILVISGVMVLNAQDMISEPSVGELAAGQNATAESNGQWFTKASSEFARQEVSYVQVDGKFYLTGGDFRQEMYNPITNTWSEVAPLPITGQPMIDHIQGVAVNGLIYYIGGLFNWPNGDTNTVYIYNPATDTFTQGANMPSGRGRGAGGVAAYNGKIYYAGGLHSGAVVNWFDVYNPSNNTWTSLPNMPIPRDHFQGAVVNGKFYAIAGRKLYIDMTTTQVDVYDFISGNWSTLSTALPTPRGGFAVAVLGSEILVIGGETWPNNTPAHHEVEAYNVLTNTWRTLAATLTGRHGIQAAVCNGAVYIAAGGLQTGGGAQTSVQEVFTFGSTILPCAVESPANAAPTRNFYITPPTPTLTWRRVNWATSYQIQIADNSRFATTVCCDDIISPNQLSFTAPSLPSGTWYWRVRALKANESTWGAWSAGEIFVIG